jgi:hypothetical protein
MENLQTLLVPHGKEGPRQSSGEAIGVRGAEICLDRRQPCPGLPVPPTRTALMLIGACSAARSVRHAGSVRADHTRMRRAGITVLLNNFGQVVAAGCRARLSR